MVSTNFSEYAQIIINSTDEQKQIENIQKLSCLLLEDDTIPFIDIINSKVIQKIIQLIQYDTNHKLQREAACILSTFASSDFNKDDQNKIKFCDILIKNNTIPILISLISQGSNTKSEEPELGQISSSLWVQGQAIDALGNIADISALMRDIILSEQILDILY